MAACFLDSSAFLRRYAQERGTVWTRILTDRTAGHHLFVFRLAANFVRPSPMTPSLGSRRSHQSALDHGRRREEAATLPFWS